MAFAAGDGGAGLAQLDVAQPDGLEGLELAVELFDGFKELSGLVDGHVEDVADVLVLVLHLERGAIVACAVAFWTIDVDGGQEAHFEGFDPRALAAFAAPALYVEGEAPGLVAAHFGQWGFGEELADISEDVRVGGWVAPWGATEWRLVDLDDLVNVPDPLDALVG